MKIDCVMSMVVNSLWYPVDTGRKLNVPKTFRRRPGRLLNVLCTFNLRTVSAGQLQVVYSSRYVTATTILLQNATETYYQMRQLLQNLTFITK